jgi:ketosteroid isomerase-like protein
MLDLERARAFVDSYDHASRAGDPLALADHYAEPYTSFTLGRVGSFADRAAARAQMIPWMQRFKDFGLDDIRLVNCDLAPVSDSFCLCHLTFEIHPKDGGAPLRFLNVYGLRQDAAGQRFEFAISDNEIACLLQHRVEFMSGIAG